MTRQILIALTATMLAFAGSTAFAADNSSGMQKYEDGFSALDTNGNGLISQHEFKTHYKDADIYNTWDADHDGLIDENEFADGLWNYYDDDDDGYIDDAEWQDGVMVDDYGEAGFWDF